MADAEILGASVYGDYLSNGFVLKTVGFFGGTFDPIHFGHIHLALQMVEQKKVDEVLFCPAFLSPFKTDAMPYADAFHRISMLRLSIEGLPHFRATAWEIDRKEVSYTIDTLRALQKQDGGKTHFRLILSEESATRLPLWKEAEELLLLAPPLIGARNSFDLEEAFADRLQSSLVRMPMFPISATEIRHRLHLRLYCGHLVSAKTLDYIHRNQLYTKL